MNTLRVAKPEKGQKIEAMLIQMAQTGQLGGRIGEDELIGLLGKLTIPCTVYRDFLSIRFTDNFLFSRSIHLYNTLMYSLLQKKYLEPYRSLRLILIDVVLP